MRRGMFVCGFVMALAGAAFGADRVWVDTLQQHGEVVGARGDGATMLRFEGTAPKDGKNPGPALVCAVRPSVVIEVVVGADAGALAEAHGLAVEDVRAHGDRRFATLHAGTGRRAMEVRDQLLLEERVLHAGLLIEGLVVPCGVPADPYFVDQYHLLNTGQSGGVAGVDPNVVPVWMSGITGAGVTVCVVDIGVQHTHPDLSEHYNAAGSIDTADGDGNPLPPFNQAHGTACAGLAVGNNDSFAGVGSAYNAELSAGRLDYATATDTEFASTHDHAIQVNEVYSNSFGPSDSQLFAAPLSPERLAAIENGVANGRAGRGVIYVVAGGNGGQFGDEANFNGFASSRFTISVPAIDHAGVRAFYSEPSGAHLVNAVSSGTSTGITTTDLLGPEGINGDASNLDITTNFGGTSASAPIIAGVVALMLEANPQLGWRDVQQILARTAVRNDTANSAQPIANPDLYWSQNASGLWFHHYYGFGLADAHAAVQLAQSWTNVGPALQSVHDANITAPVAIPDNGSVDIPIAVSGSPIDAIETVELFVDLDHTFRGDVRWTLISPDGVASVVSERPNDPRDGYAYIFTFVRHLDDSPEGTWTLRVADTAAGDVGVVNAAALRINGVQDTATTCVADFDADGDVDLTDFGTFGAAFGSTAADAHYNPVADFDSDGDVDLTDFGTFGSEFGSTGC